MSDLRELYQELILDHGRNPRNQEFPAHANRTAEGYNPLCGDRITLKLEVEGDVIRRVGFRGAGCAISQAAASTMSEAIEGRQVAEVLALFEQYRSVVMGETSVSEGLGKLAAFAGVAEFPMRVKCATLAWHTLLAALEGKNDVTTE